MNMLAQPVNELHQDPNTRASFLAAMASAVTPVSVVTTDGPAGRFGMTVSAVTSLSADPPMVLACINQKSPALEAIRINAVFCINMLSTHQSDLADCFAGRPGKGKPYDFSFADWMNLATGSPALEEAVAAFDCTLEASQNAGSHSIIIGNVMSVKNTTHSPLAYTSRSYQALQPALPLQNEEI